MSAQAYCACAPVTIKHFTCGQSTRAAFLCVKAEDYAAQVMPTVAQLVAARHRAIEQPGHGIVVTALERQLEDRVAAHGWRTRHLPWICTFKAFGHARHERHTEDHTCSPSQRPTPAHDCLGEIRDHRHG